MMATYTTFSLSEEMLTRRAGAPPGQIALDSVTSTGKQATGQPPPTENCASGRPHMSSCSVGG